MKCVWTVYVKEYSGLEDIFGTWVEWAHCATEELANEFVKEKVEPYGYVYRILPGVVMESKEEFKKEVMMNENGDME